MVDAEIVPIADAGDAAEYAAPFEQFGRDVDCLGDATQVLAVDADGEEDAACDQGDGDHVSGFGELDPVRRVDDRVPVLLGGEPVADAAGVYCRRRFCGEVAPLLLLALL